MVILVVSLIFKIIRFMGVPANIFQGGGRQFARLSRKLPDFYFVIDTHNRVKFN